MTLASLVFAFFCIITIIVYFIVPKKIQWFVLLIASLFFLFYNNFSWQTVCQASIILLTSYFIGRKLEKYQNTKKAKWFLLLGCLIIIGLLGYLKYTNFFLNTIKHFLSLFHISFKFKKVTRTTLVGLSYYSLIMISYLVDIYRGKNKSEKNIFKLALFMSYFPILSSGPFVRFSEMKENLFKKHKLNYKALCNGLIRILWGVFKILVISERLAMFVNTVYSDINQFNGFYLILAALMFTLQLYTNFSGSIDIIMGVSEIIGIPLPENFTAPFFSRSITELWRNWHITLGAWLKDYIFYPLLKSDFMQKINTISKKKLGKKIGKKVPLYLSMLIMWLCIGIWHGGAYTYVIGSGLLQFIYIFFEDNLASLANKVYQKLHIKTDTFSFKLYQIIRTYLLFSFSMIFFRAPSVKTALKIIQGMFVFNPWILLDNKSLFTAGLDLLDFRVLIISLIALFIVEYLSTKGKVREKLAQQNIVFRWSILYLLIFAIIIFGCYGVGYDPATFIYEQF